MHTVEIVHKTVHYKLMKIVYILDFESYFCNNNRSLRVVSLDNGVPYYAYNALIVLN